MKELRENCAYFKANGFETGAWVWTFWLENNKSFTNMRSLNGTEITEFMCPLDKSFVEFAAGYIRDIAETGVDIIQFDDDFRYGFLSDSPACLCDRHIAEICRLTGEQLTREEIQKHILTGGKNKYRDAYLKANGDALRAFAAEMRRAVNQVNPEIRLGACACLTAWDIDGTDAAELLGILAGKTRPFARLIGVPYWAAKGEWGSKLQDVIELERMESSWTESENIELFAEGGFLPKTENPMPRKLFRGV